MRPPVPTIPAPPFPNKLRWINAAMIRMDKQLGRPVLVEFWDFLRVNSLRTLPYLVAWHERYADRGLRVIGVHAGGFEPSRDPDAVADAVQRLGVPYPVVVDERQEIWDFYGNRGWPARYLWNAEGTLHSYHYGEGAYDETEREIQELLGIAPDAEPLLDPIRPEDEPGAELLPQTEDQPGAYSGPYEAGAVWVVVDGRGTLRVNGEAIAVETASCIPVVEHPRHTAGELVIEEGEGVSVLATCFTPAPP